MGERIAIGLIILGVSLCEIIDMALLWGSRLMGKQAAVRKKTAQGDRWKLR
ncbi:hypothetical protein [Acetonema longum]|uniref:Uncharacterized protein n=1 Tax=Acetonema longum DSM 6540 TaxID=1009370 RepID=F7NFZ5_9FIRM|nr:hypothetical protein [Acetonema longum]EGO65058.1 hypothetical protein ALO_04893 [Acetonema longum DSM 6540]